MPDWDAINKRKRKEINLGMAKNGAVQLLKYNGSDLSNQYKSNVRLLFILNEELDKELLEREMEALRNLEISGVSSYTRR